MNVIFEMRFACDKCRKEQLEKAQTADPRWNASQLEMVYQEKMHGFMRMYWARKILEWTRGPEEALEFAIYLNDKYKIDGQDPNGYVGCMWSVCGIHDQGWRELEHANDQYLGRSGT